MATLIPSPPPSTPMTRAVDENRVRRLRVGANLLASLLHGHKVGPDGRFGLIEAIGVPDDLEIVDAEFGFLFHSVDLTVASKHFTPVPFGAQAPDWSPTYNYHLRRLEPQSPPPMSNHRGPDTPPEPPPRKITFREFL